MPLFAPVLAQALYELDEPAPPSSPQATAEAWATAWWTYASQMSFWNPVTLPLVELAAKPVFAAILAPGCVPTPVPATFFVALEAASIAAWVTGSTVPLSLLPLYLPIPLIPPPVPGALVAALLPTIPIGLASPTKHPVRTTMAVAIDLWSHLFLATLAAPPNLPVPIL